MGKYTGVPDVGDLLGYDEGTYVDPIKDGHPHTKCCEECAMKDPTIRPLILDTCAQRASAFYCVHREEFGPHRVCAGFDAYDKANARRARP